MNFGWILKTAVRGKRFVIRNAPHFLMGLGTGSSLIALIFAVNATPAAMEARQSAMERKENETGGALTAAETVKACGKFYIPAAGMELFSLLCFWGAHGIDMRRQAILAGCLSTAEQALIEYQRKVTEMIGDKPEKEIRQAIAEDKVRDNPPMVLVTNDEDQWCMIRGQYFRSSYNKIKAAENEANHEMIQHMYISELELFWLLDPEHRYLYTDGDSGSVGWNIDRMLQLDMHPVIDDGHKMVLVVEYRDTDGFRYDPKPGFSKSCM